jgi:hypothetical protein
MTTSCITFYIRKETRYSSMYHPITKPIPIETAATTLDGDGSNFMVDPIIKATKVQDDSNDHFMV